MDLRKELLSGVLAVGTFAGAANAQQSPVIPDGTGGAINGQVYSTTVTHKGAVLGSGGQSVREVNCNYMAMIPKSDGSYATFLTEDFVKQVDPQGGADMIGRGGFDDRHELPSDFAARLSNPATSNADRQEILTSLRAILSTAFAHNAVVHQTCEAQYDRARGRQIDPDSTRDCALTDAIKQCQAELGHR